MSAEILSCILQIVPVIPSLATDMENLFRGKPKAGAAKWQSIELALSQSIAEAAAAAAKLAPAGTKTETISNALAVFSRDVNDASVKLFNDLHLFAHGSTPAIAPAPTATPAP